LPTEAVLCIHCGYHQRKKKKVARTFQPLARTWETDYTLGQRLVFFAVLHGGALMLGLLGAALAGEGLVGYLASWFFFGLLLAFLVGTYDRLDLTRDRRGRLTLKRTRRICFIPCIVTPLRT